MWSKAHRNSHHRPPPHSAMPKSGPGPSFVVAATSQSVRLQRGSSRPPKEVRPSLLASAASHLPTHHIPASAHRKWLSIEIKCLNPASGPHLRHRSELALTITSPVSVWVAQQGACRLTHDAKLHRDSARAPPVPQAPRSGSPAPAPAARAVRPSLVASPTPERSDDMHPPAQPEILARISHKE